MFEFRNTPKKPKPEAAHTDKLRKLKAGLLAGLTVASMSAMEMGKSAQAGEIQQAPKNEFKYDRNHPVLPLMSLV
jgi:hypothetical protein